ncbi:hypothetical protein CYMTET_50148 [Cymbomonas tetramitiformis]|uniref:J domain-containing protein n=1 Tax=Cymbomonas tetramitiformis TaxID=36881 RepID=A0AAE0BPW5_9CHLO|nr:hypothetical protein CYMTET_50148 [Cymbomonas tetramitiformis]
MNHLRRHFKFVNESGSFISKSRGISLTAQLNLSQNSDLFDPYAALGASRNSQVPTADALKEAYRQAVKQVHPDINTADPSAEANFKKLTEVYEKLLNSQHIRAWPHTRHSTAPPRTHRSTGEQDEARKREAHMKYRAAQAEKPYEDPLKKQPWGKPDREWTGVEAYFEQVVQEKSPLRGVEAIEQAYAKGMMTDEVRLESYNNLLWFCKENRELVFPILDEMAKLDLQPDYETLTQIFKYYESH